MKTLVTYFLLAFFLIPFKNSFAQVPVIAQVGCGEYFTSYRTTDGRLFTTSFNGTNYVTSAFTVKNIVAVDGAQYTNVAIDSAGAAYELTFNARTGAPLAKLIKFDAEGNLFTGNSKVFGWYQGYLTLRNGNIWMWGQDLLLRNGDKTIAEPIQLNTPKGKTITNLVVMTQDAYTLMALASDGSVWKYTRDSPEPIRIALPGPAKRITGVGAAAYVVETDNDLLAWGYLGSYLGLPNLGLKPQSIKAQWVKAGCVFPIKELVGNYNTLHIIDANNNMFGAGENVHGEVGNGKEWPTWKTYKPNPYAWSWTHGQLISKPVQIPGKFKNLCTSNTITCYFFVQDLGNNWYSWGRNKARCLGNGIVLALNEEAKYPDANNVPAPKLVTPLSVKWRQLPSFDPEADRDPLSNAGVNQYITANKTTLNGNGSSQQNGRLVKYTWTKFEGNDCSLGTPNAVTTSVTGLSKGDYVFRLTVTNDKSVTSTSDVTVVVK